MRNVRFAGIMAVLLVALAVTAGAADIRGTYLESRDAEVYASHCFANSEIGLRGNLAVMAWKIEEGVWNGVSLNDLGVVAVVKASATLGDPFSNPMPAKAALIVDERASVEQREALTAFAKHMAGGLLETVVRTDMRPISVHFDGGIHAQQATLTAGELVSLKTRAIKKTDSLCHLDDVYYSPLVKLDHAMAAFALESRYSGEGLDVTFNGHNRSSAYLGTFSVGAPGYTD
jgi:hypothetical protein